MTDTPPPGTGACVPPSPPDTSADEALVRALGEALDTLTPPTALPITLPPTRPGLSELTRLQHAALQAHLVVSEHRWSAREAVTLVDHLRPLVTSITTDQGQPGWLLLVGGNRAPVATLLRPDHQHQATVNAHQLAALLGSEGPEAVRTWLGVEQGMTLSPIASPSLSPGAKATPQARLWALLRTERRVLRSLLVYALFTGLMSLATPIAVQGLVNAVAFGAVLQPLIVLTILLAAALAFAGLTKLLEIWAVEILQRRVFIRTAIDLAQRLGRADPKALKQRGGPELVNHFFDVVTLQKSASSLLLSGLDAVLQIALGMLLLAFYHPLLLAFDLALVLALVALGWMGRGATKTAIAESSAKYAVAAWLESIAATQSEEGDPRIRADASPHADTLARTWLARRQDHFRVVFAQASAGVAIHVVASAALLGLGGWLVIQGQLSLGQLVAAELIVTLVVSAISRFGKYLEIYYDVLASIEKVGSLVDLPLADVKEVRHD